MASFTHKEMALFCGLLQELTIYTHVAHNYSHNMPHVSQQNIIPPSATEDAQ